VRGVTRECSRGNWERVWSLVSLRGPTRCRRWRGRCPPLAWSRRVLSRAPGGHCRAAPTSRRRAGQGGLCPAPTRHSYRTCRGRRRPSGWRHPRTECGTCGWWTNYQRAHGRDAEHARGLTGSHLAAGSAVLPCALCTAWCSAGDPYPCMLRARRGLVPALGDRSCTAVPPATSDCIAPCRPWDGEETPPPSRPT
jgi:hypothetical protein